MFSTPSTNCHPMCVSMRWLITSLLLNGLRKISCGSKHALSTLPTNVCAVSQRPTSSGQASIVKASANVCSRRCGKMTIWPPVSTSCRACRASASGPHYASLSGCPSSGKSAERKSPLWLGWRHSCGKAANTMDRGAYRRRPGVVRRALYIAALPGAFRWSQELKAFYAKLIARGKSHKAALVACARKLLIFANTVATRGIPWQQKNNPQKAIAN